MGKDTAVFVTDKRQELLAEYLPGKTSRLDWRRETDQSRILDVLKQCDQLILPIPVSKLEKNTEICRLLKEELIKDTDQDRTVFAGAVSPAWKKFFEDAKVTYYDLLEDEETARRNAYITAEATVAEILKYSAYSICGQKMIVCGYGRCGREVSNLLSAMGAKVTVLARSREARKLARREGHEAVDFCYAPEEAYGARTVVNTVPALVIRESFLREMHEDTVIIDIASRPGGTDLMAAEACGIKVVAALGLPGKYTTKSSARVLADAIGRLQPPQKRGGEKPWILQIAI